MSIANHETSTHDGGNLFPDRHGSADLEQPSGTEETDTDDGNATIIKSNDDDDDDDNSSTSSEGSLTVDYNVPKGRNDPSADLEQPEQEDPTPSEDECSLNENYNMTLSDLNEYSNNEDGSAQLSNEDGSPSASIACVTPPTQVTPPARRRICVGKGIALADSEYHVRQGATRGGPESPYGFRNFPPQPSHPTSKLKKSSKHRVGKGIYLADSKYHQKDSPDGNRPRPAIRRGGMNLQLRTISRDQHVSYTV